MRVINEKLHEYRVRLRPADVRAYQARAIAETVKRGRPTSWISLLRDQMARETAKQSKGVK